MTKEHIIKKLEEYKILINSWNNLDYDSPHRSTVRTAINKDKAFVRKVVKIAGTSKVFDIAPPPAVGGFIMRNVNPFEVLFDAPYGINLTNSIIDSIDEAIGVIESSKDFTIERELEKPRKINKKTKNLNKVFLVHGHDNELKETVARFLEKIDLKPIILHEQANKGQTIIEKFEEHSDVSYALVLMSPDDVGNSKTDTKNLNSRARQNVIFELGYFFGKLGRQNVCALLKGDLERPSDSDGIIYIGFDNNEGWKMLLAKELKVAGLQFDGNKIF